MSSFAQVGAAFALGFALGAAPGPVQLLILAETARRGLPGGLRVMLGANGTLLIVMVVLAMGFSSVVPSATVLDALRVVGGGFLVYLAADELIRLRRESGGDPPVAAAGQTLGPTTRGVVSVLVNPGAWIFFATTASALIASATAGGGRDAAFQAAVAVTVGVSLSDLAFTPLGSGGRRLVGERGLRWIRGALSLGLAMIGAAFVAQGIT